MAKKPGSVAVGPKVGLGFGIVIFSVLLVFNVLFVLIRRPNVVETSRVIRAHSWKHTQCEDLSQSCESWVDSGMCRWDRTTQRLCRESCDRCEAGSRPEALHSIPQSLRLPAFAALARSVELKVSAALVSEAMSLALEKIGELNGVRLAAAKISPHTCHRTEEHAQGAALVHDFLESLSTASVQDACRFDMLPLVTGAAAASCEDAHPDCVDGEACRGADFASMMQTCRRTCGFCGGGCHDKSAAECAGWAKSGQCTSNSAFMLDSCPEACGLCRQLHDRHPPHYIVLWNGLLIPSIGFGTAGLGPSSTFDAVTQALKAGYRHLDSAQAPEWYREDLTAKALAESGVPREEVFVTTKVHPRDFGFNSTLAALRASLQTFGTAHLDLVLLHYPACWGTLCGDAIPQGTWKESWRALEAFVNDGKALSIGVSNFGLGELLELLEWAIIPPAVVQRNSDVFNQDKVMHRLCLSLGIRYEAYSSLGTQYLSRGYTSSPVLSHPGVQAIAKAHACSPAQVVLSYALSSGQIVLPRSTKVAHMEEALAAPHARLTVDDFAFLASLDHHLPALS